MFFSVEQGTPCQNQSGILDLPDDLLDAFEAFKLAILRHKADRWRGISLDEMLGTLESLKELALAPSGDEDVSGNG